LLRRREDTARLSLRLDEILVWFLKLNSLRQNKYYAVFHDDFLGMTASPLLHPERIVQYFRDYLILNQEFSGQPSENPRGEIALGMLKDLVIHIRLFNSFPQVFPMRNRLNSQNPATVILAGFLVLSSAIASHAQVTESEKRPNSIKYQILLQSGTTVPGSDRPLVELTAPAISGQNIAFLGSTATVTTVAPDPLGEITTSSRLSGVYSLFGGKVGKIREVENQNQLIKNPNSPGRYTKYQLSAPAIYHRDIAFTEGETILDTGYIPNETSKLWVLRSGQLSTLSSCNYSLRSGLSYLPGSPDLNQTDVVVAGSGGDGCPAGPQSQLIRFRQGTRETLGKAYGIGDSLVSPKISGENILFRQRNLYLAQAGQLINVFQVGQSAPSKRFTVAGLCGYDIQGNRIVFCVTAGDKGSEIALKVGNQVRPIITDAMTVPGESRKFSNLSSPSISGENILFAENDVAGPVKAIYVKRENKILKIVGVGTALNGATVTELNLGTSPISGEQVVFGAKLSNGKSALVKAQF
jgi:hypothetical protein